MAPSKKLKEVKSILDLHENIFHEIFRFLDNHTISVKIRGTCRVLKIYADNFIQLRGVFVLNAQGYCQLLHMYKLKQNTIFISIQPRTPYPAFDEMASQDAIWTMFNDKLVALSLMRSKESPWKQDDLGKMICENKNNINWPCELMLQNLYDYSPKEGKWMKNCMKLYDQHIRVLWYPVGNIGLILASKNNISKHAPHPVCFPDPLIITPDYRTTTFYDGNTKQYFSHLSNDGDLNTYLNIPLEISTLRNPCIIRVTENKVMIFGGRSAVGQNSWLWQGELTNKISLIEWTRKCNIGDLRYFYWRNPFGFTLGDDLYFIVYGAPQGSLSESHKRQDNLYCDRYNLTEDKYTANVYSVPSNLQNGFYFCKLPSIVLLKDKDETFALILAGENRESSFLFTAGKGFDYVPTVIYPPTVPRGYLCNLNRENLIFNKRIYYPIKVL